MFVDFLLVGLVAFLSIPAICGYYAHTHGRSFWLWFAIGTVLPVFSYFILLLLPDKKEPLEDELHNLRIKNHLLGLKQEVPTRDFSLKKLLKKRKKDKVHFNVQHEKGQKRVAIVINGYHLTDMVRKEEAIYCQREKKQMLAGAYQGLPARTLLPPAKHLMGVPNLLFSDNDGRAAVLVCSRSGSPENWALLVKIEVYRRFVVWRNFRNHQKAHWPYENLGPFIFERIQYEEALANLKHYAYR